MSLIEIELRDMILECDKCYIRRGCKGPVPGRGSTPAPILILGEAPGEDEDAQGKPFVGKSGAKLRDLLRRSGYKSEDVYIDNAVRCRPPDNRNPKSKEITNCSRFMIRLLDMVKPTVIVALGTIPAYAVTGMKRTIGSMRDKKLHALGCRLVVTYHPSYLIRFDDEDTEILVIRDLRRARELAGL